MSDDQDIIEPTPYTRAEERRGGPGFRLRPIPTALVIGFLILALVAAFIFSARVVRFAITPAPSSLSISRGFFTWRLGERFLMLPGNYHIRATRPGYEVLDEAVKVGDSPEQDFTFKMTKLPGVLHVAVSPADAEANVFVDASPVGKAPVELDSISPGAHRIRIVSKRYLPYSTDIDIKGKRIEQSIAATLKPAWATVTVSSRPPSAEILVDGDERGQTPAGIDILQGSHEIVVNKAAYKPWRDTISVVAGKNLTLPEVNLIRADGKVAVVTDPPGANVTIGGQYRGQSPLTVTLRPGKSYSVLLSKVGFAAAKRNIDVEPDKVVDINTRLMPVTGTVTLQVSPAGGQLFVDGKAAGAPSRTLTLTSRKHHLRIVKPGYATWQTDITPQPGFAQQLNVTLETTEQAKVAAIPAEITAHDGIKLKLIIPGELHMGAGRREPGRRSNEIRKVVRLTRPYYLGIDEVTNAQYNQFDPGHDSGTYGRALLSDDNRPVVNVSWNQAAAFCNWLSSQQGLPNAYVKKGDNWVPVRPMNNGYRLPTEAEWAWAARYANGPHPTRFPWGNDMPPKKVDGNYADESARDMVPYIIDGYNDHYRGPSPVGSFAPNRFGIYDLAGNVSEWIDDFYSVALPNGVLVNPLGPASGAYHVIRGSNYTNGRFSELRWTYRNYGKDAQPTVGFRVARYVK